MNDRQTSFYPTYLRAWRRYKGIGVDELAAWSNVSRITLYRVEQKGKSLRPSTLGRLADTLGVSREQLLHEAPPKTEEAS